MREGTPLPARIANAPTLHLGLELFYNAFWDLTSCRDTGWGVGQIPWLAMRAYAVAWQFNGEQEEELYQYIRAMDNVYIDYYDKKNKTKGGKISQSASRSTSSRGAWRSGAKRLGVK